MAITILPSLEGTYAQAATIIPDETLPAERVTYPGAAPDMKAYVARPKKDGNYPAVVVIHENRGLNAHIEDVTRRAALAGYLAIAPDALSPFGGTPATEDEGHAMFGKLDARQNLTNFIKALNYLKSRKRLHR